MLFHAVPLRFILLCRSIGSVSDETGPFMTVDIEGATGIRRLSTFLLDRASPLQAKVVLGHLIEVANLDAIDVNGNVAMS